LPVVFAIVKYLDIDTLSISKNVSMAPKEQEQEGNKMFHHLSSKRIKLLLRSHQEERNHDTTAHSQFASN
jgi:hypothetical protein